jgi:hypothetical protein
MAVKMLAVLKEHNDKVERKREQRDRAVWSKAFSKNTEAGQEEVCVRARPVTVAA